MLWGTVIFLICYFITSINPAIIISKKTKGIDIRESGSKNAGATNAIRVMGKKIGVLVFVLDLIKVIVSYLFILIILSIFNEPLTPTYKTLIILSSIIGHMYPIYYRLTGGKGVTVFLMGCMLVDYKATLVCLAVGIIVIIVTRWVSLGSICGALLISILSIFMDTNFYPIMLIICSALVIFKHKKNINRLIAGTEHKIFKKD